MGRAGAGTQAITPQAAIRRFDVFAEVNRLKALADGRPEDEAKGYGIWLAKVVAGRRFGRKGDGPDGEPAERERKGGREGRPHDKFRHVGDELQTDETFEQEIVERMGQAFYKRVFAPAVAAAVADGQRYEQFRDTIRAGWKPAR